MFGYMIGNSLQQHHNINQVVIVLTQVEVDKYDSSFYDPTKYIGPVYQFDQQQQLQTQYGWKFKQDGK